MPESAGMLAKGNINPSRFVKIDTTNSFGVLLCGSGDKPFGISQVGTYDPPGVSGSTAFAAASGQTLEIFQDGDVCLLEAGTTAITPGDYLKSDASGRGVPVDDASATLQEYGAVALQASTAAGQMVRVKVTIGEVKPA